MLQHLLPETFEQIIDYCTFGDIKNLSLSCHTLNECLKDVLWKNVSIPGLEYEDEKSLDKITTNLHATQTLQLCYRDPIAWSDETKIAFNCEQIFQHCCNLEAFETLYLPPNTYTLLCDLGNLTELRLSKSYTDDTNMVDICKHLLELRVLRLRSTLVTDVGMACLSTLLHLNDLDIGLCTGISDASMSVIGCLGTRCWEMLCFRRLHRLTDEGVFRLAGLSVNLLDVSGCAGLTMEGVDFCRDLAQLCVCWGIY